jgi:hypothetical protein
MADEEPENVKKRLKVVILSISHYNSVCSLVFLVFMCFFCVWYYLVYNGKYQASIIELVSLGQGKSWITQTDIHQNKVFEI